MTSLSNFVAAALLAVRVLLDISNQRLEQYHDTSDVISTLHKLSSEGFRDWFLEELYTLEVRASSAVHIKRWCHAGAGAMNSTTGAGPVYTAGTAGAGAI